MFAVCFGGVGALLTWRLPGHPVSWILAAAGLVSAVNFATIEYRLAGSAGRRHLPAAQYAGWVRQWIWVPLIALITVYLFLLFPDGHLPSPRWQTAGWLGGVFAIIAIAGLAFLPSPDRPNLPGLRNPLGMIPAAVPFDAVMAGLTGLLGCAVLAAWSLAVRAGGHRGTAAPDQVAGLLRLPGGPGPGARGRPVADPRDPGPDRRGRGIRRRAGGAGRGRGRRAEVPAL